MKGLRGSIVEELQKVVARHHPDTAAYAEKNREMAREIAQLFRDTAVHELALLTGSYTAGARGAASEDRRGFVKIFGPVVERAEDEIRQLGEFALGL